MKKYFQRYGEVTEFSLMLDRETGKSRGFGFITFKDPRAVEQVLSNKSHVLDGKVVDCKEAVPKSADTVSKDNFRTRKIFVGGLPHELTEEIFSKYFNNYGTVTHSQIIRDRDTNKPRGFGFVTFDSEEAVENVIRNLKDHKLMGKWVECKKATPSTKLFTPKHKSDTYSPTYPKPNSYYYQNMNRLPYATDSKFSYTE
jgi:RNA recognition motif-containing protein